jgi:excisionase family DNA binding protein
MPTNNMIAYGSRYCQVSLRTNLRPSGRRDLPKHVESMNPQQEPLCLSVPEAAKILGISRGLAYELARSHKLPAIRLGRRLLVPKTRLEQMLNQLP